MLCCLLPVVCFVCGVKINYVGWWRVSSILVFVFVVAVCFGCWLLHVLFVCFDTSEKFLFFSGVWVGSLMGERRALVFVACHRIATRLNVTPAQLNERNWAKKLLEVLTAVWPNNVNCHSTVGGRSWGYSVHNMQDDEQAHSQQQTPESMNTVNDSYMRPYITITARNFSPPSSTGHNPTKLNMWRGLTFQP